MKQARENRKNYEEKKGWKGDLQGFPDEIVEKMLENQEKQIGKRDVGVFEKTRHAGGLSGGFDWWATTERDAFWRDVIFNRNFDAFFERYPKKNMESNNKFPRMMLVSDAPITENNPGLERMVMRMEGNRYIALAEPEKVECLWFYAAEIGEKKWVPKKGDVCDNGQGLTYIYKERTNAGNIKVLLVPYRGGISTDAIMAAHTPRLATKKQRREFFNQLKKAGYRWDAVKMEVVEKANTASVWDRGFWTVLNSHEAGDTVKKGGIYAPIKSIPKMTARMQVDNLDKMAGAHMSTLTATKPWTPTDGEVVKMEVVKINKSTQTPSTDILSEYFRSVLSKPIDRRSIEEKMACAKCKNYAAESIGQTIADKIEEDLSGVKPKKLSKDESKKMFEFGILFSTNGGAWAPTDGDVVKLKGGGILIYKGKNQLLNTLHSYALLYGGRFFTGTCIFTGFDYRLATREERCLFFEKMVEAGYKWNAKKKVLTKVEKWEPKDGDIITQNNGWITIFKKEQAGRVFPYATISEDGNLYTDEDCIITCGEFSGIRGLATSPERQRLISALDKDGKIWNAEKKQVETKRWRADKGESYYYIDSDGLQRPRKDYRDRLDGYHYELGNYFRTESEATEFFNSEVKPAFLKRHKI